VEIPGQSLLTFAENIRSRQALRVSHGYRLLARDLEKLHLADNSDDFRFHNQMLAQIFLESFHIAESVARQSYFAEASLHQFAPQLKYGFGCLSTG